MRLWNYIENIIILGIKISPKKQLSLGYLTAYIYYRRRKHFITAHELIVCFIYFDAVFKKLNHVVMSFFANDLPF